MDKEFLQFLLEDGISTNIGPSTKEMLLHQAETEYSNGNVTSSIFYQTYALYQASQERYNKMAGKNNESISGKMNAAPIETIMAEMSAVEISEFTDNSLMQYVAKSMNNLQKKVKPKETSACSSSSSSNILETCNFLKDATSPLDGVNKLMEICQQLCYEWTVIQLCKGSRTETTYSIFPKIHESDAAIYLTILKHARSQEYGSPLCLRFSSDKQKKLYETFATVVNRFKQCILIDPKDAQSSEGKRHYWSLLEEINRFIATACADLCDFFYPWTFLFTGIPYSERDRKTARELWNKVDTFCDLYQWDNEARVLLSLAASNAEALDTLQIEDICSILTASVKEQEQAGDMLKEMQSKKGNATNEQNSNHYPCILVVDERLDHFFWEEINVQQEFTRVNSIQSLWRLYHYYKSNIRQGYLCANITNGGCLLNPDKNLQKMESRMVSFFEYWTPHWTMLVGQRPTQDELFNNYAGHGSGLQYINGRKITKHQMNCVVFLFGCDSSRLHSNGLYSELVGPHLYYQAAMCPALVGTLMPGLDCNMDKIATEILSRWIAPKSTNVLPWSEIDEKAWAKEYVIKPKLSLGDEKTTPPPSVATTPNYNVGSLCRILSRVHQRVCEPKLYNTVPYVCRGLPVWNCDVEPLPTASST